jgi:hypothetical protein
VGGDDVVAGVKTVFDAVYLDTIIIGHQLQAVCEVLPVDGREGGRVGRREGGRGGGREEGVGFTV